MENEHDFKVGDVVVSKVNYEDRLVVNTVYDDSDLVWVKDKHHEQHPFQAPMLIHERDIPNDTTTIFEEYVDDEEAEENDRILTDKIFGKEISDREMFELGQHLYVMLKTNSPARILKVNGNLELFMTEIIGNETFIIYKDKIINVLEISNMILETIHF